MGFQDLKKAIQARAETKRIAIVLPEGEEIYEALATANAEGLCRPVLVGDASRIKRYTQRFGLQGLQVIQAHQPEAAAELAVQAVKEGRADLLMKGQVSSSILLKAVLKDKGGLRQQRLLSHVLVVEKPEGGFLGMSDGGLNIAPGLNEKIQIVENAAELFRTLGIELPKIAALSAVETINPDIPSTLEAAQLAKMAERNQLKKMQVDGPLALDLALSPAACQKKGVNSPLAGAADILLVPDLVSGNLLGKSLVYIAGYPAGGLVIGAACPIILLSRSDSAQERLNSIILGAWCCQNDV